jgi:hypothetical protein
MSKDELIDEILRIFGLDGNTGFSAEKKWLKEILTDYGMRQYGQGFEDGYEKGEVHDLDKKLVQSRQETLLELVAMFDDYNHPITMEAEYVREQIIKLMKEKGW